MAFISHEHKFVFIHITKTAGTSISSALCKAHGASLKKPDQVYSGRGVGGDIPKKHQPNPLEVHSTLIDVQRTGKIDGYLSFCVIRNPWERIFSFYQNRKRMGDKELEGLGFAETFRKHNYLLIQPQTFWMRGLSGEIEIGVILRMESLEDDFNSLIERMGIDCQLPRLNRSDQINYRDQYDDYSRRLVSEHYRYEIERYGYEF